MWSTKLLILLTVTTACWAQGNLLFEDNFDTLDDTKWLHEIGTSRGGNNEFQIYRNDRKNSWVEGGVLHIKATPVVDEYTEAWVRTGYLNMPYCNVADCVTVGSLIGDTMMPYFSASLQLKEAFTFGLGRVEVKAKVPRGDWLWPAIWMLPQYNKYGGWPASGEIDIMETRGNRDYKTPQGVSLGVDTVGQTLHWGPRWPYNGYDHSHWEKKLDTGDYSDDFHVFEVERRADRVTFRIDGVETGSIAPPADGLWNLGGFNAEPGGDNPWAGGVPITPFEEKFHLILNIAVGGTFFADDAINAGYPRPWDWYDGHPIRDFFEGAFLYEPTWDRDFQIDYVRVYD